MGNKLIIAKDQGKLYGALLDEKEKISRNTCDK